MPSDDEDLFLPFIQSVWSMTGPPSNDSWDEPVCNREDPPTGRAEVVAGKTPGSKGPSNKDKSRKMSATSFKSRSRESSPSEGTAASAAADRRVKPVKAAKLKRGHDLESFCVDSSPTKKSKTGKHIMSVNNATCSVNEVHSSGADTPKKKKNKAKKRHGKPVTSLREECHRSDSGKKKAPADSGEVANRPWQGLSDGVSPKKKPRKDSMSTSPQGSQASSLTGTDLQSSFSELLLSQEKRKDKKSKKKKNMPTDDVSKAGSGSDLLQEVVDDVSLIKEEPESGADHSSRKLPRNATDETAKKKKRKNKKNHHESSFRVEDLESTGDLQDSSGRVEGKGNQKHDHHKGWSVSQSPAKVSTKWPSSPLNGGTPTSSQGSQAFSVSSSQFLPSPAPSQSKGKRKKRNRGATVGTDEAASNLPGASPEASLQNREQQSVYEALHNPVLEDPTRDEKLQRTNKSLETMSAEVSTKDLSSPLKDGTLNSSQGSQAFSVSNSQFLPSPAPSQSKGKRKKRNRGAAGTDEAASNLPGVFPEASPQNTEQQSANAAPHNPILQEDSTREEKLLKNNQSLEATSSADKLIKKTAAEHWKNLAESDDSIFRESEDSSREDIEKIGKYIKKSQTREMGGTGSPASPTRSTSDHGGDLAADRSDSTLSELVVTVDEAEMDRLISETFKQERASPAACSSGVESKGQKSTRSRAGQAETPLSFRPRPVNLEVKKGAPMFKYNLDDFGQRQAERLREPWSSSSHHKGGGQMLTEILSEVNWFDPGGKLKEEFPLVHHMYQLVLDHDFPVPALNCVKWGPTLFRGPSRKSLDQIKAKCPDFAHRRFSFEEDALLQRNLRELFMALKLKPPEDCVEFMDQLASLPRSQKFNLPSVKLYFAAFVGRHLLDRYFISDVHRRITALWGACFKNEKVAGNETADTSVDLDGGNGDGDKKARLKSKGETAGKALTKGRYMMEESTHLLEMVLEQVCTNFPDLKGDVRNIKTGQIDWHFISESMGRVLTSVREHWTAIIQPAIKMYLNGEEMENRRWKVDVFRVILELKDVKSQQHVDWKGIVKHFPSCSTDQLRRYVKNTLNRIVNKEGGAELSYQKALELALQNAEDAERTILKDKDTKLLEELVLTYEKFVRGLESR